MLPRPEWATGLSRGVGIRLASLDAELVLVLAGPFEASLAHGPACTEEFGQRLAHVSPCRPSRRDAVTLRAGCKTVTTRETPDAPNGGPGAHRKADLLSGVRQ